ncbi:LamG domain-containing protein [Saccharothrix sp. S26]|uniref:LamG-like jellyroll fold domain-containing protein n=1 Tax=Saccharothrix sp. S26 TaxID=2907215 RepID=UPI001F2565B8|nr:LamG-like jellyroll fold domain-containing protein [Saccharothrix sp. S26]MCE6996216.1 LamG domain-containing protein [Saccharothrix sp. S26]
MGSRVHARGSTLRAFALALVATVAAGVVVVPPGAVAQPEITGSEVPKSAPDEATAARYAARSGESVVVESATTETDEVRANPDGSMTFTQHVQPVRVRRGDGWVPVDLTLERRADGSFAPKASTVEVAFSPGGTAAEAYPLAKVAQGGHEVGLRWDGELPEPVVDGATLTYPNVLPDVDLRVEAHLEGFSELLVIKTPEAGRNPALDTVTFPTHAEDVRVEHGSVPGAGDLVVRDGAGKPVFVGDASQMWDSSGDGPREHVGESVPGDRQTAMEVEVTPEALAITPDQGFLDDPGTTYPVVLDPTYYCGNCGKVHHAVVQDHWPDARNFDATGGALSDLKAGFVNPVALGDHATKNSVSRSYLQMNTEPLIGKYIHRAIMRAKVINTYSCAPSATELRLAGWIDANTTWNNQTSWGQYQSSTNVRNNPGNCPTDGNVGFEVGNAITSAAAGSWSWTTFVLKAEDESALNTSWRRFDLNPYLEVQYNSYPNTPTDLGMEGSTPDHALPCRTGADRPVVSTRTPRLRARVSDPDNSNVYGEYRLLTGVGSGAVWDGRLFGGTEVGSGAYSEWTVPADLTGEGGLYTWQVVSHDGQLTSPSSAACEFEVDTTPPNAPAVSSADYPGSGFNHGSVGKTGTFTFTPVLPADGRTDVRKYGWSLNNDTAMTNIVDVTSADGSVTVPITPTLVGTNVLHVRAFDRANNPSPQNTSYTFHVAGKALPKAVWAFDETSGTVAADSSGGNRPLALSGAASFAAGYDGNALTLNGGFAASASTVVDTSRAFSVSAWAKLNSKGSYATLVSQDGNRASSFYLQYAVNADRWAITTPSDDADGPASYARVTSAAPPQVGVWTHLLATYEPNSKALTLYVDGKPEGTTTAQLWNPSGSLVVGRAKSAGEASNHFPGAIDSVRVWDRVVTAEDAAEDANRAVLRARLGLDERTGTTTRESVSGQQATISGGATWAGTPDDPDDPDRPRTGEDEWLQFDTSGSGQVTASRPVNLRTDRSYTVSAWVRLDNDQAARAAVSLGDAQYSPFMLQYRPENRQWAFLMTQGPATSMWWVALSDNAIVTGQWVHLTGTYDAVSGRIALYVNGDRQTVNFSGTTDGSGVTGWNGSGPLWLGRGLWGSQKADVWQGAVDDARVYSGVLTSEQIRTVYESTRHF